MSLVKDPVIVIDDVRAMSGSNGYPSLLDIFGLLPRTSSVEIALDQILVNCSLKDLHTSPG